jgi:hypothetical protein
MTNRTFKTGESRDQGSLLPARVGLCYLAFPAGNHSRFEHSIGAYYVSGAI